MSSQSDENAVFVDDDTGHDKVDIYSLPYGDYDTPRELRMVTYGHVPGLELVKGAKGRVVGVKCVSYNDFGAYMVNRFHFKNAEGSVTGWDGDERVSNDKGIIDLITKVGFDVFDTDKDIFNALRAIERYAEPVDVEEASNFIGFANGTYDIRDDSWHPGVDSNPTLYTIPHDYDPTHVVDKDGVMWQCLDTLACHRDGVRDLMVQVIAFCLLPTMNTREVPLLVSPGQHGKSTFLEIIMSIIGEDMVCSKSVHELCERFGLNDLRGKALNIADDEDVSVFDPAMVRRLKIMASHGRLFADRKGVNGVEFRIIQRIIIASNAMPRTTMRDANNGLWDRLVLVPFDADFSDTGTVKRDPAMAAKLKSEDAIADAISLALGAIREIRDNGWRLVQTDESTKRNREAREMSDNVLAWLGDEACDVFGYDEHTNPLALVGCPVKDAYEMYSRYCKRCNMKPAGLASFSSLVTEHCRELSHETTRQRARLVPNGPQARYKLFWDGENVPSFIIYIQFDPFKVQTAPPDGIARIDRATGVAVTSSEPVSVED